MPFKPLSKHWLEAATVILAAGARNGRTGTVSGLPAGPHGTAPAGTGSGPPAGPHGTAPAQFDYRVLMLQRSGKSGFMPNAKVFPGGVVDASDFSEEWMDVFKAAGLTDFKELTQVEVHADRSPMFTAHRDSPVPNEVGYRICAIRETFEESGVLLVRPWASGPTGRALPAPERAPAGLPLPAAERAPAECPVSAAELARWRKRVDGDAREFIKLCKEHRCVPDVWSLYEWSNWLTPVVPDRPKRRRYDTAFFICCLDHIPPAARDDREIVRAQWLTPAEVLHDFRQEKHIVPPPQVYELSRLCQVPSLAGLHHFSRERGGQGCERWLPIVLPCEDGQVTVLPGDDLYPTHPEVYQGSPLPSTVAQLRQSAKNIHRRESLQRSGFPTANYRCNIPPRFGHLPLKHDVFAFVEWIQSKL
ncbi:nucleoside diphosphate-linked moiety X motif 19-like [Branchiostoma floridae]|uniref:Acyl-coenzyme A diphosphatase NUDT19 n=1 Tax=Branchiostoma floridae TaxID=7739 RepID=A0A9J7N885_BRAFL|nr:nucleoside diphosphate-linked moiety X motif 19-like [Branchiostoma floridae]